MKFEKLKVIFNSTILPLAMAAVLVGCTSSKDSAPSAPASERPTVAEQEVAVAKGANNVTVINLLLE